MEERGVRRALPFTLPAVMLVAALLSGMGEAGAAGVERATVAVASAPTSVPAPPPPTPSPTAPASTDTPLAVEAGGLPPPAPTPAPRPPRPRPVARATVPPPPAPPPVATGRGTWAVVIGINDYPGSGDLWYAVNDATTVRDTLVGVGVPPQQVLVLTDRAASRRAVSAGLDWLVANAGPDAVAVVFYAGHVVKEGGREALHLADGLMSDAELAVELQTLQARRAWIAVAGCYGAGFDEVLAPGRVLTGASARNERAYETTEFGHSYLVEYMVERAIGERRTAPIVQDAFVHAYGELARDYPDRLPVQLTMDAPPVDLRG